MFYFILNPVGVRQLADTNGFGIMKPAGVVRPGGVLIYGIIFIAWLL